MLIGIHTPETNTEHDFQLLKKKLSDAKLSHAVAVDNDHVNWNSYGNRYWPSVYLIDKKGNARFRWDGELEWQGSGGGKIMHEKIKLLMAEK